MSSDSSFHCGGNRVLGPDAPCRCSPLLGSGLGVAPGVRPAPEGPSAGAPGPASAPAWGPWFPNLLTLSWFATDLRTLSRVISGLPAQPLSHPNADPRCQPRLRNNHKLHAERRASGASFSGTEPCPTLCCKHQDPSPPVTLGTTPS